MTTQTKVVPFIALAELIVDMPLRGQRNHRAWAEDNVELVTFILGPGIKDCGVNGYHKAIAACREEICRQHPVMRMFTLDAAPTLKQFGLADAMQTVEPGTNDVSLTSLPHGSFDFGPKHSHVAPEPKCFTHVGWDVRRRAA